MQWEALLCLVVLGLIFAGLMRNLAPDAILLGSVVILTIAGVISPEEAFSGFSNTGMLTVGALFVVAAAMRETGALDAAGAWLLGRARTERGVLVRMAASLPVMSAFLNNTPIVAMFIPIVSNWCRKHNVAPSRLLLPLSYFCIVGGTCTLIGTSTNLVVNGLMNEISQANPQFEQSLSPMGFFELTSVGLPYAVVGTAYLLLIGPRLLPRREDLIEKLTSAARNYLVDMEVKPDCKLVGQTVQQAGLRHLPGLFLIEAVHGDRVISPVPPNYILRSSDILTFTGVVNTIVDLEKIPGLVPVADEGYEIKSARRRGQILCEAVVSKSCPCVGRTIRAADFRALYNAAVVAVHRGGERLAGKVGDMVLRPGDTLLLQAGPHFARANRNNSDFLLVTGVEHSRPLRNEKAVLSLLLLLVLIAVMISQVVPIVVAALLTAGFMVLTRCISISSARESVDWQTLITIASAFGLARAFQNAGLVDSIASYSVQVSSQLGASGVLAAIYLITSLFAATVGNNAAAALLFPFAVAIATEIGVNPRTMVMGVVFAASASFISPLSYQTNLMVYGPGGYRFSDFVKVGLPLSLLLMGCATVLVPIVWPF